MAKLEAITNTHTCYVLLSFFMYVYNSNSKAADLVEEPNRGKCHLISITIFLVVKR